MAEIKTSVGKSIAAVIIIIIGAFIHTLGLSMLVRHANITEHNQSINQQVFGKHIFVFLIPFLVSFVTRFSTKLGTDKIIPKPTPEKFTEISTDKSTNGATNVFSNITEGIFSLFLS
jgi:hypothetical protein